MRAVARQAVKCFIANHPFFFQTHKNGGPYRTAGKITMKSDQSALTESKKGRLIPSRAKSYAKQRATRTRYLICFMEAAPLSSSSVYHIIHCLSRQFRSFSLPALSFFYVVINSPDQKTASITLFRMSKSLCCRMEDLPEY